MTFTRSYTLFIGIAFILDGIGGFIPIITTQADATAPELVFNINYGYLLGMFPVDFLHNLFLIVAGLVALWAVSNGVWARRYCQLIGMTLLVFIIMGRLPELSTTFGMMPLSLWLYGLEAGLALYLGFCFKEDYKLKKGKRRDRSSWRIHD